MAAAQTQQDPTQTQEPDYLKDYWAQDRPQVLASKGLTDTSGKTWNGTTWVDGGQAPPAAPTTPTTSAAPAVGTYMPQGYDQTKWNDPNKHDPKYDVGRILSQYVPNSAGLQQAAPALKALGYTVSGKDTITGPDGTVYDVGQGFSAAGTTGQGNWYWNPTTGAGGAPLPTSPSSMNGSYPTNLPPGSQTLGGFQGFLAGLGGGSATGSSMFGTNPAAFNTLSNGLPYPGQGSQLFNMMMGRASQSEVPSAQDPIIANQVNAYRAEQERGARNAIDQQAEASGPYSNLNSERRLANEHAAQSTGQLQAQLMGNELTARRQQIMQYLQMGSQFYTDEQKLALQQQLSMIDAWLKQQGITNQNNQFLDEFGLNATDKANYWDAVYSGRING